MIKGNDDTRFGRRLESLFWWFLRLFPLVVYLVFLVSLLSSKPLMQAFVDVLGSSPNELILNLFGLVRFDSVISHLLSLSSNSVVFETLIPIFEWTQGVLPFLEFFGLVYYASYLVLIEIIRFFVNFFCFIVRLVNSLFDRMSR